MNPEQVSVEDQVEAVLAKHVPQVKQELLSDLMSLIETVVDDAFIAGKRGKEPPRLF